MQPQDVFNRAFDDTTAAIDAWLPSVAADAAIEHERTPRYWRVRLVPHQPNACPAELMLSRDQHFDFEAGSESVVGQSVQDFSIFLPLLKAVVDGRVVQRSWTAVATGAELTREFIARLAPDKEWPIRRIVHAASAATEMSALAEDRAFVAYARR